MTCTRRRAGDPDRARLAAGALAATMRMAFLLNPRPRGRHLTLVHVMFLIRQSRSAGLVQ